VILRPLALALALALAWGATAGAGPLGADGSSGTLEFSATQADAKFTGAFRRFQVVLDFDPAQPVTGQLDVDVDTASIDSQDAERDEILRGPEFFSTARHPKARFHATRFERAGNGWRANGELTIRGVTKPVPVTFTLVPAGTGTVMKGSASLRRLDFGLGQGEWASTEWVGDEVDVRFELKLQPVG
jgi:polyisoprenoid-binding protein YceI